MNNGCQLLAEELLLVKDVALQIVDVLNETPTLEGFLRALLALCIVVIVEGLQRILPCEPSILEGLTGLPKARSTGGKRFCGTRRETGSSRRSIISEQQSEKTLELVDIKQLATASAAKARSVRATRHYYILCWF